MAATRDRDLSQRTIRVVQESTPHPHPEHHPPFSQSRFLSAQTTRITAGQIVALWCAKDSACELVLRVECRSAKAVFRHPLGWQLLPITTNWCVMSQPEL